MAHRSTQGNNQRTLHLDALGPRNVVFCHQCEFEWYEDEYGLECPSCDGKITEIVVPGVDDPRPNSDSEPPSLPPRPQDRWTAYTSDPEESYPDQSSSNRSTSPFITFRTFQTSTPRSTAEARSNNENTTENAAGNVLTGFQNMISHLLGPQIRHSTPGRSGPNTLVNDPNIRTSSFRINDNGGGNSFVGGRFIFTNIYTPHEVPLRPRNANEPQTGEPPQVEDIITTITNILASSVSGVGADSGQNDDSFPRPPGFQTLFSAYLRPGTARFGDAVYSQEALDQILTALMEESTTSNAPGPASEEAIAALPRKKLDAKLLGPEGKGECSICMDEVKIGDEVMVLSCKHWFDETCVTAWLKEHNTCPICRKGIEEESVSSKSQSSDSVFSPNENRSHRQNVIRTRSAQEQRARNEERLSSLSYMAGRGLSETTSEQTISRGLDNHVVTMPGSFPTENREYIENTTSTRTSTSMPRSATENSNNNSGLNNAFRRLRGLQDRMNNTRRNN